MNALQLSIFRMPFRIADPWALWLLAVALLLLILVSVTALRRHLAIQKHFDPQTRLTVIPGASGFRIWARHALAVLALAFMALALSRPQFGTKSEIAKRFGIDVVIAIDASKSMLARDIKPSRIDRAKLELGELLDKLNGDRVGIVVFAGDAFTQCPLTSDYAAAKLFLKAIDVANMPIQGTDLTRALEESKDLLLNAEHGATSKVIVLLTDGEDTTLSKAADAEVERLKEMGVKILSVGLGSTSGEPIPELDKRGKFIGYKKDRAGNTVMSKLDESGLKDLANKTGGTYIRADGGGSGIQRVVQVIDGMQKQELESRMNIQYEERFVPFAFMAFLLLLASVALRPGRKQKLTSVRKGGAS